MSEFLGMYEMAEAARYLHVTAPRRPPNYYAVRRWVRSGQLPCIKLPRGIRIPSEVRKDLIRSNLQQEAGKETA